MKIGFPLLDAAEPDPRPRWKRQAEQTVEVRLRHIPEEARDRILAPRLKTLDAALAAAFEGADYAAADGALYVFDQALLKDALAEYENMRAAAGDGVEELLATISAYHYNGIEIESGRQRLAQLGERLSRVSWWSWETNKDTRITRAELRAMSEPSTYTRGNWADSANFTPERELRRLEEEAAASQRGETPPGSDSRNYDYPSGVRP